MNIYLCLFLKGEGKENSCPNREHITGIPYWLTGYSSTVKGASIMGLALSSSHRQPVLGTTCYYEKLPEGTGLPVMRLDSTPRSFKPSSVPCKQNGIMDIDLTLLIKRPLRGEIAATIVERSSALLEGGLGIRVNGVKGERFLRSVKTLDSPSIYSTTWDVTLQPETFMTFCSFPIKLHCIELELEFQGTDCEAVSESDVRACDEDITPVECLHLKPNIVQAPGRRCNELVCVDSLFQLCGLITTDPKVYLKRELLKKEGAFYHSGIIIRWYTYGESKKQLASLFTMISASGAILNYSRFYLDNTDHAAVVATVLLMLVAGVSSFNLDYMEDVIAYCMALVCSVLFLVESKYVLIPNVMGIALILWMILSCIRASRWIRKHVSTKSPVTFQRGSSVKDGSDAPEPVDDLGGQQAGINYIPVLVKGKASMNHNVAVHHKLTSSEF